MKIALFHNLHPGGAKRALYEHARGLRERGHVLDGYTLNTATDEYLPLKDVCDHVYCHELESTPAGRLDQFIAQPLLRRFLSGELRTLRAAYLDVQRMDREQDQPEELYTRMAAEIDSRAYDLVYVHQCHLSLSPALLRRLKTPTIYYAQDTLRDVYEWSLDERPNWDAAQDSATKRNMLGQTYPLPFVRLVRRKERQYVLSTRAASLVLVNSWYSREAFVRTTGINPHVCYLGVDAELFCPDHAVARERVVLSVGALAPNKNHEFIIEALATLPVERRPRLRIIGYEVEYGRKTLGRVATALVALAEKAGVQLQIDKEVTDEELRDAYRRAGVVAFAPVLEPFGFIPLEASACEAAVVGVSEGGLRETIQHETTGLLTGRAPEEFAAAIDRLLNAQALAAQLGANGRRLVLERWTWRRSVDELEGWITRQVAKHRTNA